MAEIKELLAKAMELELGVKAQEEEIKRLNEHKKQIVLDNLRNIVIPFAEEYIDPVINMYKTALDKCGTHFEEYTKTRNMYDYSVGYAHIWMSTSYRNVLANIGCSTYILVTHEHEGTPFIEALSKQSSSIIDSWFSLVGDVDKAKKICDELKEVALLMCSRIIEMFTWKENNLSETVKQIEKEIAESSHITVNTVEDNVRLVLNGREYICTPKE